MELEDNGFNFPVPSPRSVEEEAAFARPRLDETENEAAHAHLRGSDRSEGHQGPDPVQVGNHPGSWLPRCAAAEEDGPRSAHVYDANDALSGCPRATNARLRSALDHFLVRPLLLGA